MAADPRELARARRYRDHFLKRTSPFSKGVEDALSDVLSKASVFDIETGGLSPQTTMYETGFMHGIGPDSTFSHSFVNPGKNPRWEPEAQEMFDSRMRRNADAPGRIKNSPTSQRKAAFNAYREMKGRDVWIQNIRHERSFLNQRTGPALFDTVAQSIGLESFTSGGGLYTSPLSIKREIAEATRVSNVGSLDAHLNAWERVFTHGFAPELAKTRNASMTRAFDISDLTKSVFAMAQKHGHMAKTGELFTGTSVDAFSRAFYGVREAHAALPDNVLQGQMIRTFMGAGYAMQAGEELPQQVKDYFRKIGEMVPDQKHRNAVKNIVRVFQDQERFRASRLEGAEDWDLLKNARVDTNRVDANMRLNVRGENGAYTEERLSHPVRERIQNPAKEQHKFATEIEPLVKHWDARQGHGVKVDYQRALAEARSAFITPYQESLAQHQAGGLGTPEAIRRALSEPLSQKVIKGIESKNWATLTPTAPETMGNRIASTIKKNWKFALGGALAVFAANAIAGDDDAYNYIEGMRHGGMAGGSRKSNTDFGSGLQKVFGVSRSGILNVTGDLSREISERWGQFVGFAAQSEKGAPPSSVTERLMDELSGLSGKEMERFHKKLVAAEAEPTSPIIMNLGGLRAEYGKVKDAQTAYGMTREEALSWRDSYSFGNEKERDSVISRVYHSTLYHESVHARGGNRMSKMGAVPEDWAALMSKTKAYQGNPDGWYEEYLAYGAQHLRYPGSINETNSQIHSYFANRIPGRDDAYNVIEGLNHHGIAHKLRKRNTDFGSGWNALRGLVRAGETFAEMVGSAEFKSALKDSSLGKELGRGKFGVATSRKGVFRGHEFDFVRKKGLPGQEGNDFRREKNFLKKLGDSVSPDYYAFGENHLDMEMFDGLPLSALSQEQASAVTQEMLEAAISKMHESGVYHSDLHYGNLMYVPEKGGPGRIGIIDLGHPLAKIRTGPEDRFIRPVNRAAPGEPAKWVAERLDWDAAKAYEIDRASRGLDYAKRHAQPGSRQGPRELVRRLPDESSGVWVGNPAPIEGRPLSNTSGNVIEGLPESQIAKARRRINTGGQFESPWQGMGELLTGAKKFASENPKILAMIGAGAVGGFALGGHSKGKKDSGSFLGTVAKAVGVTAAIAGFGILAPAALTAFGAKRMAQMSGQANPNAIGWKTFKGVAKANWEFVKTSVGIHYKVHTGESAKLFKKSAEAAGVDTSWKALAERGWKGPWNLGKKAVHHTAQWLGKNWVPQANKFEPGAVALAVLSGYEAVGIGRDVLNGDFGSAAWGVAKFAGAKYAYMGWHNRAKIMNAWKISNKLDKTLSGIGVGATAMNYQAAAMEGINMWLAHARWGVTAKEFYPKVGAEFVHGLDEAKEKLVATATDLLPELSGVKKKDVYMAAAGIGEKIRGGVKHAGEVNRNEFVGTLRSSLRDQADALDMLSKKYAETDKPSVFSGWIKGKVETSEQWGDKAYGYYKKGVARAEERLNASDGKGRATAALKEAAAKHFSPGELAEMDAQIAQMNKTRAERRAERDAAAEEIFGAASGTAPGRVQTNVSGNTIGGLPEQGFAGANRGPNTDGQFGSPWQGLPGQEPWHYYSWWDETIGGSFLGVAERISGERVEGWGRLKSLFDESRHGSVLEQAANAFSEVLRKQEGHADYHQINSMRTSTSLQRDMEDAVKRTYPDWEYAEQERLAGRPNPLATASSHGTPPISKSVSQQVESLGIRPPTVTNHPNRQASNIVSAVAEQVAEKTAKPAVAIAEKTVAANPVARAKGMVSGNGGWIAAGVLGLGGLFWAMSGSSKKDGGNQFGSAWRGLIKILKEDAIPIFGWGGSRGMSGGVMPQKSAGLYSMFKGTFSKAQFVADIGKAVEKGVNYPVFINARVLDQRFDKLAKIKTGSEDVIREMETSYSQLEGVSINRREIEKSLKQELRGTIKHERFHQKMRNLHGGEMASGEVPVEVSEILAKSGYGDMPSHWYEEYLAHKEQYRHYPESLIGSSEGLYAYFKKEEAAGRMGITPARRREAATIERAARKTGRSEEASRVEGRPASNVNHNTIEGLPEQGMAKANRGPNTDDQFGSPWQGLRYIADDLFAIPSEQYAIYKAREDQKRRNERPTGYVEGLNRRFEGDMASVSVNDFVVEDADTIRLFMDGGKTSSIRLAGIDAPEIEHEGQEGKIAPNQPFGQEAKSILENLLAQQSNLQVVMDPNASQTYGRNVGMLVGDNGQNLNLELVRQGAASSLPFGKKSEQLFSSGEFKRAEEDAAAAQTGMWSYDQWNISRQLQLNTKRKITNVSFTDLGRVFKDFKTASVLTRMQNPDAEFSDMQAAGGRSDFNIIEGMRHGWAQSSRETNLEDFGSGFRLDASKIPSAPRSFAVKRKVIESQYVANTRMRVSMRRDNNIGHGRM